MIFLEGQILAKLLVIGRTLVNLLSMYSYQNDKIPPTKITSYRLRPIAYFLKKTPQHLY